MPSTRSDNFRTWALRKPPVWAMVVIVAAAGTLVVPVWGQQETSAQEPTSKAAVDEPLIKLVPTKKAARTVGEKNKLPEGRAASEKPAGSGDDPIVGGPAVPGEGKSAEPEVAEAIEGKEPSDESGSGTSPESQGRKRSVGSTEDPDDPPSDGTPAAEAESESGGADAAADESDASAATSEPAGPSHPAPPTDLAPGLLSDDARTAKAIEATIPGVQPASFQGITPGQSTRVQVIEILGEPIEAAQEDGGEELLTFKAGPFPKVQVALKSDLVSAVVVHLVTPMAPNEVAEELNLKGFRPVTIHDEHGQCLGEVFPERGLMFAYRVAPGGSTAVKVGHVVLERVVAEPFFLRAKAVADDQYGLCLSDLEVAKSLAPDDVRLYELQARVDMKCGRLSPALKALAKATELDPDSVTCKLMLVDVRCQAGLSGEAMELVDSILSGEDLTPLEKAEAMRLRGRLLATVEPRDFAQAMEQTVEAIKLAVAHISDADLSTRKRARQALVDGELSLATIIAHGPWKKRFSVVPEWLVAAEQAATTYVVEDGGPRTSLLSVYATSLHCLAVLEGQGSPVSIADAAIQLGRDLIAEAQDDDYQAAVEWQLGTALWHAAQVEQKHGDYEKAMRLADNANALLTGAARHRADSPVTDHHLGQLHFLIGSIHALHKKDAATAMRWYEKALPRLQREYPADLMDERGMIGEQLVSVGVLLWETKSKDRAVAVTEEGAERMMQAVHDGLLAKHTLAVPYQNLAVMHKSLGNRAEAQRLAEQAAALEPPEDESVMRR